MFQFDDVRGFILQAIRTYRKCRTLLGLGPDEVGLAALVSAARRDAVPRTGSVVDPKTGQEIDFHIHGNGYTFQTGKYGNEIRFNARRLGENERLTFTAWDFHRFLIADSELVEVESRLREICQETEMLTHFRHGLLSYYIWMPESSPHFNG